LLGCELTSNRIEEITAPAPGSFEDVCALAAVTVGDPSPAITVSVP
jgi:hypothetical protein